MGKRLLATEKNCNVAWNSSTSLKAPTITRFIYHVSMLRYTTYNRRYKVDYRWSTGPRVRSLDLFGHKLFEELIKFRPDDGVKKKSKVIVKVKRIQPLETTNVWSDPFNSCGDISVWDHTVLHGATLQVFNHTGTNCINTTLININQYHILFKYWLKVFSYLFRLFLKIIQRRKPAQRSNLLNSWQ